MQRLEIKKFRFYLTKNDIKLTLFLGESFVFLYKFKEIELYGEVIIKQWRLIDYWERRNSIFSLNF
jgi:hypothetical protein